jgi:hypothetical protein
MLSIPLEHGPVRVTGAYDFDRTDTGIMPRRLPEWTRIQMQPFIDFVVAMASGIRLEFVTDSDRIELDAGLVRFDLGGGNVADAVFDLEIDHGAPVSSLGDGGDLVSMDIDNPGSILVQHGKGCTVVFNDLGKQPKHCALWLPANAQVELRELRISDTATISAAPDNERPRWVHHGSSISHCMEANQPTGTWPVVAARLGNVEVINLGLGGACHLDQFVARTMRDIPADFLSVKVGINVVNGDTLKERTFAPALHGFLDTIRDGKPDTPLLVISPIFCPAHEKVPGPTIPGPDGKSTAIADHEEIRPGSLTLEQVREIINSVVNARRAAGDSNLHYLDGLALFGEADVADLPDDLHPNAAGYARMGKRFRDRAFGPGAVFAALT